MWLGKGSLEPDPDFPKYSILIDRGNNILKFITSAIGFAMIAVSANALTFDEDGVRSHCKAEWSDDFEMQTYCVKNQKAGFDEIAGPEKSFSIDMQGVFDRCIREWGIEYEMSAYCLRSQIEGLRTLATPLAGIPAEINETILLKCGDQWPNDLEMTAYCAKNQASAWRELNGG